MREHWSLIDVGVQSSKTKSSTFQEWNFEVGSRVRSSSDRSCPNVLAGWVTALNHGHNLLFWIPPPLRKNVSRGLTFPNVKKTPGHAQCSPCFFEFVARAKTLRSETLEDQCECGGGEKAHHQVVAGSPRGMQGCAAECESSNSVCRNVFLGTPRAVLRHELDHGGRRTHRLQQCSRHGEVLATTHDWDPPATATRWETSVPAQVGRRSKPLGPGVRLLKRELTCG